MRTIRCFSFPHLLLQLHRVLLLPAASISLKRALLLTLRWTHATIRIMLHPPASTTLHPLRKLLFPHLLLQLHRVLLLPAASVRFVLHSTIKTNI